MSAGGWRDQFANNLSPESVRLRFHGLRRAPSDTEAARLTNVDFVDHVALVATPRTSPEELIGVARYVIDEDRPLRDRAEVAFLVVDEYQGRGVGSLLLLHLATIAKACDIREFKADVLADNSRMIRILEHSGFPIKRSTSFGVVRLVLAIAGEPMTSA